MASLDTDVTMVPAGEGPSDAPPSFSAASASLSSKKAKRFEIKKWNAVALWAWGKQTLTLTSFFNMNYLCDLRVLYLIRFCLVDVDIVVDNCAISGVGGQNNWGDCPSFTHAASVSSSIVDDSAGVSAVVASVLSPAGVSDKGDPVLENPPKESVMVGTEVVFLPQPLCSSSGTMDGENMFSILQSDAGQAFFDPDGVLISLPTDEEFNEGLIVENSEIPSPKIGADEVFACEEGLGRSNPKGEYVTLPSLGQGVSCRHTNRVKVWTINLNGRVNIAPADQLMAEETAGAYELPNIEGYVGVFIVLDRMPSATQLPLFADVFGPTPNNVSSLLDQSVRVDQLSRFKVLMRERKYVNTGLHGTAGERLSSNVYTSGFFFGSSPVDEVAFIAWATAFPTIWASSLGSRRIVLDVLDPTWETYGPGSSSSFLRKWAIGPIGRLTDERAC
ncbi:hypothetical protein C3L33_19747, partial [Rhododendron williamsianum]